ncbi:MAG: hypothetical protein ACFFG0_00625 [Candidatus Thorarchaeota archaeon]
MLIRIKAGECCGGICSLDDVDDSNIQEKEETECCEGTECCHPEWADD